MYMNTALVDPDIAADLRLGHHLPLVKKTLQSLKVVEYLGPSAEESTFSSKNVRIEVYVYGLYGNARSLEEDRHFPQAELTPMPHIRFEGIWDELVFTDNIKEDLLWMMINILRFSLRSSDNSRGEVNPLILLHGPPGTGKTSLCQGLAQKIAIRLRSQYDHTTLVQINTATLLSKYYSESAKQVDEIFTKIACLCQEEPNTFTCVLIDEIESIASSREFSTTGDESHDSLRATNALLTGLDKTNHYPNVIFLCTTNMFTALDDAFLDRCGLKREVAIPSLPSQYQIIRKRLQKLIDRGVIQTDESLLSHEDARLCAELDSRNTPARLLAIAQLINSCPGMSGRSLTQLPERAVLQHLREDECDMDMALTFIERVLKLPQPKAQETESYVKVEQTEKKLSSIPDPQAEKHERKNDIQVEQHGTEIEIRGMKRTLRMLFEDDLDIEVLQRCIAEARKRPVQE
ncbi:P-loop containing nucleoside triphosphate hydrolase protein [Mollisia scopiformis]|uniref:p-loop containing nucleoside triphosphate hydrolase protein n=1 Tax=Mollisia scopiformis TaxID=149040 RepID=A0A194XRD3_MOLSC|nr:P-loop containing nucleoside triphosphate hydrolase protein [Mollisia scopiformis]KUJ22614.1 P-loop containing nucleoside triphosphate hydrolase protein [Mollisia scopiformis]